MEIAVSNTVVARNRLGQFRRACEDAAEETIRQVVQEGAAMSRSMAPVGRQADPRTIRLRASIKHEVLSRTSGRWVATARHALPIEFGAGAHPITGYLSFFWAARGRMWIPSEIYYGVPGMMDEVSHPGNAAQPYLRPAYEAMMAKIMAIAAQKYPG